ncbi:MAG: 50S ribosomal protein L37ae [Candidatus Bathyarchaeota archaeon]|nr:MAG: 50S ribosomal protein L37ae [Candidatus Bathyarchaeota archaeon]
MGRNTKKVAMTRGLGTRYGATIRKRYVKVLTEVRRTHKCPQCGAEAVKRESVGIWNCRKCDVTFAGGAYTPVTKLGVVAKRQVKSATSSES